MADSFETVAKELTLAIFNKVESNSRKSMQDYAKEVSEVYKTIYETVQKTSNC